jgi:anti-sigma-K factor RskA
VNTREYIDSGIIEQFVMGETNAEQTREVMAYARQYPEIQAEIEAVENSLISLAESNAQAPKEKTREQLFDKLFNETPAAGDKNPSTPVVSIQAPMSKSVAFNKKYLVAASVALLASVGMNIYLYGSLKDSENALIALNAEKQQLVSTMASDKTNYMAMKEQMAMMNSMDVMQVKLSGMNTMPDAKAMVYYNTRSREVYLHINNLPVAPENKQYQLWAIVDGKPVDAGVFDAGSIESGMIKMKSSLKPAAFAVTIEKRGGSINPTMEQMVLIGNLSS